MAKQLNVSLNVNADVKQAKAAFEDLQQTLTKIQGTAITSSKNLFNVQEIKAASQAARELQQHLAAATDANTGRLNLASFSNSLKRSGKDLSSYKTQLEALGPSGEQAFTKVARSIAMADNPLRRTNGLLQEFKTTLMNTARWQISSSILHGFMGAIQQAYGYAQDLNESLNNIRIVTGYNVDQMAAFAAEANKAAKALSTTTTEYTNASLIYYQQGLNDKEVKARTDATIKLANVSRQSAEEVSDQLTAVWNNFATGSDNLEYYIDVMAKLGATTASSTKEISTGLEKFAAVANTVGLSYEYATSALATITATTRQSADVVGTALKTLFARIQDLELGKTLEDGTTLGKYSAALEVVGVQIKDINGEVKNMDTILDELGEKWSSISKDEQIALAQTVAGTRQYTQLVALMDNWDFMKKNLNTAANAKGELQRQADIYAESWEAASKRVKAALETIYQELLDDKFFIGVNNIIADLLDGINGFIKGMGGLKGILATVGAFIGQSLAKEAPAALQRINEYLTQITGKAQQTGAAMQTATQKWAHDEAKSANTEFQELDTASPNASAYMVEVNLIEMLAEKKRQYNANEAQYSKEEKARAQDEIAGLEAAGNALIKKAQALDQLREKADTTQKSLMKMTQSADARNMISQVRTYSQITGNMESLVNQIDQLNKKFADNKECEEYTAALRDIADQARAAGQDLGEDFGNDLDNIEGRFDTLRISGAAFGQELRTRIATGANEASAGFKNLIQVLSQNYDIPASELNAFSNVLIKIGIGAQNLPKQVQGLQTSFGDLAKHSSKTSEQLMSIASAMMQVNAIISSFKRVKDVFTDEDSTAVEKIGAVIGAVTTVLFAYNAMAKLTATTTAAEKTSLLASAGTWLVKKFAVDATNRSLMMTLAMTGLVALAIAALVAVVWLLVAAFKAMQAASPEGQLKAAEERAKALKQALDDATTAADDLKSAFDDYISIRETLDNCTAGTKEWQEALESVNTTVLKLLSVYPELARYISTNENGALVISDEGMSIMKQAANNRVVAAQGAVLAGNQEVRDKKIGLSQSKITVDNYVAQDILNQLIRDKDFNQLSLTGELRQTVTDAFKNNATSSQWGDKIIDGWVDKIVDLSDDVISLQEAIKANTTATEAENQAMATSVLANNEAFQKSKYAQDVTQAAGGVYGQLYNDLYESYKNQVSKRGGIFESRKTSEAEDAWNAYVEQTGLKVSKVTNYKADGSIVYKDDDNKKHTVTAQQIAETLAAAEAVEKLAGSCENLINKFSELDNSTSKADHALKDFLTSGDLEKATQGEFSEISQQDAEKYLRERLGILSDEDAKQYGYESAKAMIDAYNKAVKDAQIAWDTLDLSDVKITGIENISLQTGQALQKTFDKIELGPYGEKAAKEYIDGINNMLATVDADQRDTALARLATVDWSNWDALEQADTILQDLGGDIDIAADEWKSFAKEMRVAANAQPDFSQLKNDLTSISKILNGLSFGSTIKDEDYETLIGYKKAWEDLFLLQSDGSRKFIGNSNEMKKAVQDNLQVEREELQKRAAAQKALKDENWGYEDASGQFIQTDWTKAESERNNADTLYGQLMKNAGSRSVLEQLGYTDEYLQDISEDSEKIQEVYNRIATFMSQDLVAADAELDEMFASTASNLIELNELLTNGQTSIEAYTKRVSEMAMEVANNATSLSELRNGLETLSGTTDFGEAENRFYDEYAQGLQNVASQYDSCSEAAEAYQNALNALKSATVENKSALEATVRETEEHLEVMIAAEEATKKYGLEGKTLVAQMREIAKAEELSEKEALAVAIANERMNRGVAKLVNGWKDWKKILQSTDATAEDHAATLVDVSDAVKDLVGWYDDLSLDSKFVAENMDLIDKAAQGDITSILELGAAVAQLEISVASLNTTLATGLTDEGTLNAFQEWSDKALDAQTNFENLQTSLTNMFSTIQENMAELQNGATLQDILEGEGGLKEFVNQLNAYAAATGITAQEMQEMLSSVGVTANVQRDYQQQEITVPTYEEHSVRIGYDTFEGTDLNGDPISVKHPVIKRYTVPGEPYTTTGFVEVASISMDKDGEAPSVSPPQFTGKKAPSKTALTGGTGNKTGTKSGGGSTKEPTHSAKHTDAEEHRYTRVENNLSSISDQYDRLAKARDRAWGIDQLGIMDSEISKMEELSDAYEDYLNEVAGTNWEALHKKIQAGEKLTLADIANSGGHLGKDYNAIMNGKELEIVVDIDAEGNETTKKFAMEGLVALLGEYGITDLELDAHGRINNQDEIDAAFERWYSAQEGWWNDLTAEQQQDVANANKWKEIEAIKNAFPTLFELYAEDIEKLEENSDALQDAIYAIQDLKFDQLNKHLEMSIDINERQLKQLQYSSKILGDSIYKTSEVMSNLFNPNGGSQYQEWLSIGQQYQNYYDEAKKLYEAGEISQAQYIDAAKKAQDGIYGVIDSLLEMNEQMRQYYGKVLDQAVAELAKLTDQMEHQVNVMEHLKNIMSLLNRQTDYKAMDTLIRGSVHMRRNALDEATKEYEMFNEQLKVSQQRYEQLLADGLEEGAREYKEAVLDKITAQTIEAEEKMYASAEAYLEAVNELYENTVSNIIAEQEKMLTGGFGWDYLSEAMGRASAIQDEYLTKTNQIYETNTLLSKLSKDIDKTNNTASKNKLKSFSDEIAAMQQQEKLSQTDLAIAKARYEVLVAELALEDAKNAKSTVRLQRDNEGNYGYVYTADADDIAEAEQNFATKQNDLYNLVLKQANDYGQKIVQLEKEEYDALTALAEEYRGAEGDRLIEYNQKKQEIIEHYNQLFYAAYDSYDKAVMWLNRTASTDYREAWVTEYETVIDKGRDYQERTEDVFAQIEVAMEEYKDQATAVTDHVYLGLDNLEEKTSELITANDKLTEAAYALTEQLSTELEEVNLATEAWARHYEEIMRNIEALQKYNEHINEDINSELYDKDTDYSELMYQYLKEGGSMSDAEFKKLERQREAKIEGENITADKYGYRGDDFRNLLNYYLGEELREKGYSQYFTPGFTQFAEDQGTTAADLIKIPYEEYIAQLGENTKALATGTEAQQSDAEKITEAATNTVDGIKTNLEAHEETTRADLDANEQAIKADLETAQQSISDTEQKFESNAAEILAKIEASIESLISTLISSSGEVLSSSSMLSGTMMSAASMIASAAGTVMAAAAEVRAAQDSSSSSSEGGGFSGGGGGGKNVQMAFASGGYTGTWGPEGKVAILHEKELVLNASDTENILSAVGLIREFNSAINMRAAASNVSSGLTIPNYESGSQVIEQEVTIHAEFPNATNHSEIEEAFNNLVNRASQYANR